MPSKKGQLGRVALLLVAGGVSVALLFWAKLRVVTNIPRTTYADPATDENSPTANGQSPEAPELAPPADDQHEGAPRDPADPSNPPR